MNFRCLVGAYALTTLAVTGFVAADDLKSGPQVGDSIVVPFHPLNVTGKMAGDKHCLI
jgi:hypothetical protein